GPRCQRSIGLDLDASLVSFQLGHEGLDLPLLQKRLTARDYDIARRGPRDSFHHLRDIEAQKLLLRIELAPVPGVTGVAPGTAEVARTEPNEDAGHAGRHAFPLDRFENLRLTGG